MAQFRDEWMNIEGIQPDAEPSSEQKIRMETEEEIMDSLLSDFKVQTRAQTELVYKVYQWRCYTGEIIPKKDKDFMALLELKKTLDEGSTRSSHRWRRNTSLGSRRSVGWGRAPNPPSKVFERPKRGWTVKRIDENGTKGS